MIEREDLKKKVPRGYAKKIAAKAGVSEYAVSQYLNGKFNSERIEMATLEILAELGEKKQALLAKII